MSKCEVLRGKKCEEKCTFWSNLLPCFEENRVLFKRKSSQFGEEKRGFARFCATRFGAGNKESKLVVDVKGESKKNGADIILWQQKAQKYNNQLWIFENGFVKNVDSQKILASKVSFVQQEDEKEIKDAISKKKAEAFEMNFYTVVPNSEHYYIVFRSGQVRRHLAAEKNASKSAIMIKDVDFADETQKWILKKEKSVAP